MKEKKQEVEELYQQLLREYLEHHVGRKSAVRVREKLAHLHATYRRNDFCPRNYPMSAASERRFSMPKKRRRKVALFLPALCRSDELRRVNGPFSLGWKAVNFQKKMRIS